MNNREIEHDLGLLIQESQRHEKQLFQLNQRMSAAENKLSTKPKRRLDYLILIGAAGLPLLACAILWLVS